MTELLRDRLRQTLRSNSQAVHLIRDFFGVVSQYDGATHQELALQYLLLERLAELGANGQAHPFIKDTIHRWKRIRANLDELNSRMLVLNQANDFIRRNNYDVNTAFDRALSDNGYQQNGTIFHRRHTHP